MIYNVTIFDKVESGKVLFSISVAGIDHATAIEETYIQDGYLTRLEPDTFAYMAYMKSGKLPSPTSPALLP